MKIKAVIEFDIGALDPKAYKDHLSAKIAESAYFQSISWIEPEKCPYGDIRALYNEAFKLHNVTQISAKGLKSGSQRAKKLKARWNDYSDLQWWADYFDYIKESKFLMGQVPPRDGFRQFRLSIDFVINDANLIEITEGKYHE